MMKLVVTACVAAAAVAISTSAIADIHLTGGQRSVAQQGPPPRPGPAPSKKCPVGWTLKYTCLKMVPTPRPKNFPRNQPWLGEKCVKQGWKCVPPIK
jgi:hypothetical protein